jgi:hypothetical protein
MFNKMRDAGQPVRLVARPHPNKYADGNRMCLGHGFAYNTQPVLQYGFLKQITPLSFVPFY